MFRPLLGTEIQVKTTISLHSHQNDQNKKQIITPSNAAERRQIGAIVSLLVEM